MGCICHWNFPWMRQKRCICVEQRRAWNLLQINTCTNRNVMLTSCFLCLRFDWCSYNCVISLHPLLLQGFDGTRLWIYRLYNSSGCMDVCFFFPLLPIYLKFCKNCAIYEEERSFSGCKINNGHTSLFILDVYRSIHPYTYWCICNSWCLKPV